MKFFNFISLLIFSSEINFEDIVEILSDFLKNNVTYIHKEQIQTVKSLKVNIYNENMRYLATPSVSGANFS